MNQLTQPNEKNCISVTLKQLKELARSNTFVRWYPSLCIEQLRIARDGNIVAGQLHDNLEFKEHRLNPKAFTHLEILPHDVWVCLNDLLNGKRHYRRLTKLDQAVSL